MPVACQHCQKAAATVHLTDIVQGEKRERHLCADCAEEEGVIMKTTPVPLNEVLSKFVMQKAAVQELADLTCEQCGMTFVEFRSHGLLGCPNDYDAFRRAMDPLIERTHEGTTQHVGKTPLRMDPAARNKMDMIRLQRELSQSVTDEKYEEAARLRDQIQRMKSE